MPAGLLSQIAVVSLASFAAQWTAWKLHVPAIVFLLLLGFILGPVAGFIQPDELLGDLLQPAISAAVAIILFEGSLQLRFREIREIGHAVRRIIIVGAPLGWALLSFGAHHIAGLSWPVAITFGGILVVTGPTVIMPMLRHSRVDARVGSVLKWEGIINDPVGVIFAVLAYEYFKLSGNVALQDNFLYVQFPSIIIGEMLLSYLFGRITADVLERGLMPEYLKAPFLVSTVLALFTACNLAFHESGLIAVTIYGMTLANKRVSSMEEIKRFKETITLLLVSGIFILLTANLEPALLKQVDIRGVIFIAAVIFLIRPATVFLSSLGTGMHIKQKLLIGWIAPRGVVCAAIAGVMGPLLVEAGFEDGAKLLPLSFGIVFLTVILHGLTFKPLARRLGLVAEEQNGLIVVGANDWTLQLAETLKEQSVPVLLVDTNWHRLKPARLANIPVYYGEVLSEETEYNLGFDSYGTILAATDNSAYNSLVCNEIAPDFGRENVFQISFEEMGGPDHKKLSETITGRIMGRSTMNYYDWGRKYRNGWRFRVTKVGADKSEDDIAAPSEFRIKIGIISNDILMISSPESDPQAKEGDMVLLFEKEGVAE